MESLSLRVWHPSPWHSVIQGEGGGSYREGGWGEDMPRGYKKGEQGGMTSDVQYKLHFYFGRFFQDVVFQIVGERMHNNFVDVIII